MIHCLHGAVGSSRDWAPFQNLLGEELIAHDLWNLGRTARTSLTSAGEEIAGLACKDDILMGYSMGGRIALHALLAAPEKWKAAVIISAHPGLSQGRDERLQHDSKWADLANEDWSTFIKKWNEQGVLPSNTTGLIQATIDDRKAVADSFHHWSLGSQKNLIPQLAPLTLPVLWITGARDLKFTGLARTAAKKIPSVHHDIVPDSGHRVPWEQPEEFSKIVKSFLSGS